MSKPSKKTLDSRPNKLKSVQPFLTGGLSGCIATCVIQPIDMVKVRIQLLGDSTSSTKNPFKVARSIVANEGALALYRGLDAGLIRQITYTTARLGLFRVLSDNLKKENEKTLPLWKKSLAGLTAGGLGALIGNPADLSLIRLQADATLPAEARRHYKGAIDAMIRIPREEGILALWRGSGPTVTRAMSLNMGMLASFDQSKEFLEANFGPGWTPTLCASAISGFFAVTLSLPFDLIKTKIQKMKADPVTGKMPYRGFFDCAIQTYRAGGLPIFYTGYLTYYARIAPHAMITLVALDYMNKGILSYFSRDHV